MRPEGEASRPPGRAPEDAHALMGRVPDGATVLVGGFGEPGTPFLLLDALARAGARGLTAIKNDANEPGVGIGRLLEAGCLARLVSSHIGLNRDAVAAMHDGRLAVDFHPQGILAEKIRLGGAGLPGFLCDLDRELLPETDEARETVVWRGRELYVEAALRGDVALIHAHAADPFGNLRYRAAARNFNPAMALAADLVVAEVEELHDAPFDPDTVDTPGALVDHLVLVPRDFDPGTKAARMRREAAEAGAGGPGPGARAPGARA